MLPGNENGLNNSQGGRTFLISIAAGLRSVSCGDVLCNPNFAFAYMLKVPSPKVTLYNPPARPDTVLSFHNQLNVTVYTQFYYLHYNITEDEVGVI
jgi:hypothetical protein